MRVPVKLRLPSSATKTLWLLTGAFALALVVVVVVGAIRASRPPRGQDVAAYIVRVNRLQGLATGPLTQLNTAYSEFGTARARTPEHLRRLKRGARDLQTLRTQLARVHAPDKALPLRAQLLRLYDLQISFARDVAQFAQYLAQVVAPERRAETARLKLLRELRAAAGATEQADAFDAYGSTSDVAAKQLGVLRAPAEFDRARTAEIARLHELSDRAAKAARALRAGDRAGVQSAISSFAQSSSTFTVAVRQRAAAIAYNARLKAIETQRARLARAQRRLQKSL